MSDITESQGLLAEQFADLEQQNDVASLGMWVFLITEIMFFGGLFMSYTVNRAIYPEQFAVASHHMDVLIGTVNTAVLIVSSLTMALAVHAAQLGERRKLMGYLSLTFLLGLAFLGLKALEYTEHYIDHLFPGPHFSFPGPYANQAELFFSFYYIMTGLHALHVIVGLGVISAMFILAWRHKFSRDYHSPVEVSGLYWHFVDMVWIFLYPLLYLIDIHHP